VTRAEGVEQLLRDAEDADEAAFTMPMKNRTNRAAS